MAITTLRSTYATSIPTPRHHVRQLDPDPIARRVARGAELLDRVAPNWFERVDLTTLNVASGRYCTLAQVFGGYAFGVEYLRRKFDIGAPELGFNRRVFDPVDTYDRLGDAWRVEVTRRRRARRRAVVAGEIVLRCDRTETRFSRVRTPA